MCGNTCYGDENFISGKKGYAQKMRDIYRINDSLSLSLSLSAKIAPNLPDFHNSVIFFISNAYRGSKSQ